MNAEYAWRVEMRTAERIVVEPVCMGLMVIPILFNGPLMDAGSVRGKQIIVPQKAIKMSVEYVSADHHPTHTGVFETSVAPVEAEKHPCPSALSTTIIALSWSQHLRSLHLRKCYWLRRINYLLGFPTRNVTTEDPNVPAH